MVEAIAAAVLLGLINTIADVATTELRLEPRPIFLFVRIAMVCNCVGFIVGGRAKQMMIGIVGGMLIAALVFCAHYFVAMAAGPTPAVAVAWVVFWVGFSLLNAVLDGGSAGVGVLLGVIAAALSAGFYFGMIRIWSESPSKELALVQAGTTWAAAFFPGFVVLFWRRL